MTDDQEFEEQDIEEAINEMDWSGDAEVSFEEFEAWWIRRQERHGNGQHAGAEHVGDDDNPSSDDSEEDAELERLERKIASRIKADINAVEMRLDAKLDDVNERLASVLQLLESLAARST